MIKQIIHYLSVPIFSVFLGLISVPVLTHLLHPGEYGLFMTFMAFLGIANVVMTLNFHTSIGRYWYEKDANISSFITLSMIGAFVLLFLSGWIIYSSAYLQALLGLNPNMIKYLMILVIVDVFFVVYNQILAPQRESKKLAYLSISKMYITFMLGILFIYFLPVEKFLALIYAQILIGTAYSVYILYKIKHYLRFRFHKDHVLYIVSYAGPMFFYSLSAILMTQIDRVMITKMLSPELTGMYSLAFTIVNFFIMGYSAVLGAWTPNFFEHMEAKLYKKIQEGTENIIKLSFIGAAFVVLFGNYIGYILSDTSYHESLTLIPVLLLGMYFSFGYQLYARSISYSKKTFYMALTFSIAGGVNVFLNYQLIPLYGIMGAATATLFANIVLMSGGYLVNRLVLKYDDYILLMFIKTMILLVIIVLIKTLYNTFAYLDFLIAVLVFATIAVSFLYQHREILLATFIKKETK